MASVLLVEDHPLLVEGLRAVLSHSGFDDIHTASSVAEAEEVVAGAAPLALAVVDWALSDGLAIGLLRRLEAKAVPVIVLTGHVTADVVKNALDAGALGFVGKGSPPSTLIAAIATVAGGERYLCERSSAAIEGMAPRTVLSPRETQVLALIAEGLSTKAIAKRLGIAPRTVETHREHLHGKLQAHNAADLTREAIKRNLVRPE
jgi:DNA-binding NarL/FixJ family response regulator